jgi:hypothetical protein
LWRVYVTHVAVVQIFYVFLCIFRFLDENEQLKLDT